MNFKAIQLAIAGILFVSSFTAFADGNSAQTSSDYKRKNKEVHFSLPTLKMRKGEVDTKDSKLELKGGVYSNSDGVSGSRATFEYRKDMTVNGHSDENGSSGFLFSPGLKLDVEHDKGGETVLREGEVRGVSVLSMQVLSRPDTEVVGYDDPLNENIRTIGQQIDSAKYEIRSLEREYAQADAPVVPVSDEERQLTEELAKADKDAASKYEAAKKEYVLTKGREKSLSLSEETAAKLELTVKNIEAKRAERNSVQQGSDVYRQLDAEYSQLLQEATNYRAELVNYGALQLATYENKCIPIPGNPNYCQWRNACFANGVEVDCHGYTGNFYLDNCGNEGVTPCKGRDGKIKMGAVNADIIANTFPKLEDWKKSNYAPYKDIESKRSRETALILQRDAEIKSKYEAAIKKAQAELDKKLADARANLAKHEKDLEAAQKKLAIHEEALKNKKRPVYATRDIKALELALRHKNVRELGIKRTGGTIDAVDASFHVAGRLNDMIPLGLCGSIAPLKFAFGKSESLQKNTTDGVATLAPKSETTLEFEGGASLCAEVGVGDYAMIRNTSDINWDYGKYVDYKNTTTLESKGGRIGLEYSHEKLHDFETNQDVSRDILSGKIVY